MFINFNTSRDSAIFLDISDDRPSYDETPLASDSNAIELDVRNGGDWNSITRAEIIVANRLAESDAMAAIAEEDQDDAPELPAQRSFSIYGISSFIIEVVTAIWSQREQPVELTGPIDFEGQAMDLSESTITFTDYYNQRRGMASDDSDDDPFDD